jgi:hypothetical protein
VVGFAGIAVARTCKQIKEEASEVLYGSNYFVFDTRGRAMHLWEMGERGIKEFNGLRWKIPGLPNKHGILPSQRQTSKAISHLFNKKSYQPTFSFEDPFLRFCRQVGRQNISRMKRVKIEGHLKIGGFRSIEGESPIGLARLLPIYVVVLRDVCKDLRSLTLHMGHGENSLYMGNGRYSSYWQSGTGLQVEEDDVQGEEGKSDEEKIDNAVRKVAEGLPGLQHLQLGDYKAPGVGEHDLKWGKSVRWMDFVKERGGNLEQGTVGSNLEPEGKNEGLGRNIGRCGGRGRGSGRGRGRGRRGRRGGRSGGNRDNGRGH